MNQSIQRNSDITPIFIFSLPRSGSTLVQRVLASHQDVATRSEPWLLLPFLYPIKENGIISEFGYDECRIAIQQFVDSLEEGFDGYNADLCAFLTSVYNRAASNHERYFLDKTPRYHLIANEIHDIFPNAKFIYIWRNPLAVIASSIMTWGKGDQWNIHKIKVDLYKGARNLILSYKEHEENSIAVKYEDLLANSSTWKRLFDYLDLHFTGEELDGFSEVNLGGRMGDPSGVKAYSKLDMGPIEKWKSVLDSPLRKWWCQRYLRAIGPESLQVMGYNHSELSETLAGLSNRFKCIPFDAAALGYGVIFSLFEIGNLRAKLTSISKFRDIVGYH